MSFDVRVSQFLFLPDLLILNQSMSAPAYGIHSGQRQTAHDYLIKVICKKKTCYFLDSSG
jgi:hypothetical protein